MFRLLPSSGTLQMFSLQKCNRKSLYYFLVEISAFSILFVCLVHQANYILFNVSCQNASHVRRSSFCCSLVRVCFFSCSIATIVTSFSKLWVVLFFKKCSLSSQLFIPIFIWLLWLFSLIFRLVSLFPIYLSWH